MRMLELKSKNSSDHGMVPVTIYVVSVLSLGHLCVCVCMGGGMHMCFVFKLSVTSEVVKNYNIYMFLIR